MKGADLRKLFAELQEMGYLIKTTASGHPAVYSPVDADGKRHHVYTMAGTGGRGRGDTNATVKIRKHMHAWRTR